MELRGQKVLPCYRQTSLPHDSLWEFGTAREPITLTSHLDVRNCPASHWPADMGDGKVVDTRRPPRVVVNLEALSLLAMEVEKGRSPRNFGNCQGGDGSQTMGRLQLHGRLGENELDFLKCLFVYVERA